MKPRRPLLALAASTLVIWLSPLGAAPVALPTATVSTAKASSVAASVAAKTTVTGDAKVTATVAPKTTATLAPAATGGSAGELDAAAQLTDNLGKIGAQINGFETTAKDARLRLDKAKVDAKAFEAGGSKDTAAHTKLSQAADALRSDLAKLKVELGKLDQKVAEIRPKVVKGSPNAKTLDALQGRLAYLVAYVNAVDGDRESALPRATYSLSNVLKTSPNGTKGPTSGATAGLQSTIKGTAPATSSSAKKPAE